MYRNKEGSRSNKCENLQKNKKNSTKEKQGLPANIKKTLKFAARKTTKRDSRRKTTSNRVTVPLAFFSQGVKSKTVQKGKDYIFKKQNSDFLNEDLHALLKTVSDTPQNPGGTSQQKEGSDVQTHYKTVTDYYVKLETQNGEVGENVNSDGGSIFKKINFLLDKRVVAQDIQNVSVKGPITSNSLIAPQTSTLSEPDNCHDFGKKLKQQLCWVTLNSRVNRCIKKISLLVDEIDAVLEGDESAAPTDTICNLTKGNTKKDAAEKVRPLIPRSNWLYETPTDKKLQRPAATTCTNQLKPCLLQTNVHSKIVFELDANTPKLSFFDSSSNALDNLTTWKNFFLNRNPTSPFSSGVIPLTENIEHSTCLSDSNSPIPQLLIKAIKNDKFENPQHHFFGSTAKRKKIIPNEEERKSHTHYAKGNHVTATITSQSYIQPFLQVDCRPFNNKENYRPQDFSNHPLNGTFTVDENFILPPLPSLSDPPPLPFPPRRSFGVE